MTNVSDLDHNLEFCRSNMTLTFDHTHDLDHGSSWSNFEIAVSQNGRADWHFTKGLAVGHSWPWQFGDQGQVYGSTRKWPGWLQLSAVSSTHLVLWDFPPHRHPFRSEYWKSVTNRSRVTEMSNVASRHFLWTTFWKGLQGGCVSLNLYY